MQLEKKQPKRNQKNKTINSEGEFYGTAVIGTKGQFVIPKQAREKLDMKPGDQIVIFGGKESVLAVVKADQLSTLLAKLGMDDLLR